jgi:predicted LPLAT superfamily acyltransferase
MIVRYGIGILGSTNEPALKRAVSDCVKALPYEVFVLSDDLKKNMVRYASQGFTHLLTVDTVAKDELKNIPQMIEDSIASPWSFVTLPHTSPYDSSIKIYPLFHTQMLHPLCRGKLAERELAFRLLRRQAKIQKKTKPKAWSGTIRGGRFGNWFIRLISHRLGLRASYFCIAFVIPYFYLFAPKARRGSLDMFGLLYPEAGMFRRHWQVMKHFYKFAVVLLDRLYQSKFDTLQFKVLGNGTPTMLAFLKEPKGTVMVSAHFGALDLGAASSYARGVNEKMVRFEFLAESGVTANKVLRRFDKKRADDLETVGQQAQSTFFIRELIEADRSICLMGDRPMAQQYELVVFLGRLAAFDVTPFRVAALCETRVSFCFGIKRSIDSYEFTATTPKVLKYEPGVDKNLQLKQWVQEFASEFEKVLRKDPHQWANMYPFWSVLPTSPMREQSGSLRVYDHDRLRQGDENKIEFKSVSRKRPLSADATP